MAGSTDSYGNGIGDAWLLKLGASGAVEWQKTYGGSNDEYALDVRQTPDGGYIVAGWTKSFGAGQADFWVFKLNATGDIQWEKTYGGAGTEQARSVELTTDGGYIVAGGTTSFGAGGADYWVLKLDANGVIQWQKTYGGAADDGGGGEFDEFVVRVLEDEDGNYVVASETFSFGHGESDIWVIKLDSNGGILWQKAYGGSDEETLWSFQETSGGGYIVPGSSVTFSPDYSGDLWALQLEKDGAIGWQRTYGLAGYWDEALSVGATSDGGSLIGGYYEEGTQDWDLFLLRLDANGVALWQKVFEHTWDWPNSIQQLGDGGYIVAGVAWPNDQNLPEDLLLLRLAPDGSIGPSCNLIADLNLTQADTDSTPITTNAVVQETNVTPRNSSAVVQDSPAVPNYLCQGGSGGPAVFRITRQGDVYSDGAYYCGLASACFNTGGADIAEYINVSEPVEPGDVVELDPEQPGYYRKSREPYSTLVAGAVSTLPGITMGHLPESPSMTEVIPQSAMSDLNLAWAVSPESRSSTSLSTSLDNLLPLTFEISVSQLLNYLPSLLEKQDKPLLALMGIVAVKATTESGPIKPGDLLTTSSTPGYAMRCPDPQECKGAIIGKALEPLEEGKGVIKMLVMR